MHNDGCTSEIFFACRRRLDREIARYLEEAQRIILYKAVTDKEVRSIDSTAVLQLVERIKCSMREGRPGGGNKRIPLSLLPRGIVVQLLLLFCELKPFHTNTY